MRRLPLALLLLAAACDRPAPAPANGAAAQAQAPQAAPAPPAAGKVDRSRAGKAAPDTEFDDPDGDTVTLASFAGKPLLLNFWATWCGPCVKEMPTLDRLAADQGGKLQVVALSQDMDGREKVDAFFEKAKLETLQPYMDTKLALMGALGVDVLPTTILFDSQGREVWRVTGEMDWTGATARALVAEAARR
ncbi:MAG: TlpA family protein disulfide reductase [Alphaproteobacteria bacterium]|nr:TlpA family protein disulfide reductase [Alphaproteobacteria bacterium]MBV9372107.1 TlpA family protein disulfide reductase [Alphaproteobacteria bacterium]MBV9899861.1 TlpA family protein disulfide reductase [Alphaproteobacteria bacterium]